MKNSLSLEQGFAIQTEDLKRWRNRLLPAVHAKLCLWVAKRNQELTPDATGYDVTRGDHLLDFVLNHHDTEAIQIHEANEQAAQCDRNSFSEVMAMLDEALPNFKGCPAPDDWTKAALRELIEQREQMIRALDSAVNIMQNMSTGRFKGATEAARQAMIRARATGKATS